MIVSNCESPHVIPAGKQAVFHKIDAQFETRIRITPITIQTGESPHVSLKTA
jgi:hypothetical protein